MAEKTAYIGLGNNLADRQDFINRAIDMLAKAKDVQLVRVTDTIETSPLGQADQPDYLNAVAQIETTLSAGELHKKLLDIETQLGRVRGEKWTPRTIDLDLLLFGDDVINQPHLVVPHSQMHLRTFVLKGLCQLNPQIRHPILKETVRELADRLAGSDFVLNPDVPQLVSVAGVIGVGKTTMAKKLSGLLGCKLFLEPYDMNPFMPDVYAGKKELALDSQLYFLISRIGQLNGSTLTQGQIAISDYVFDKELIYARRLLNKQQQDLYEKVFQPFSEKVTRPALIIYLQDSAPKCLERIHRRNRPYEQKIELPFLEALSSDYEQLFTDWKTCPVIRISISESDYTKDENIEHLANQIRCYVAVAGSPGK